LPSSRNAVARSSAWEADATFLLGSSLATTSPAPPAYDAAPAAPPAAASLGPDAVLIVNSGSTNVAGYRIVVHKNGTADAYEGPNVVRRTLGPALAANLFAHVERAAPLDALPTAHCMKSASFGSRTIVAWNGRTSGDLTCGGDDRLRALASAVQDVIHVCAPPTLPRRRLDGPATR
jgi:hypothetical protein